MRALITVSICVFLFSACSSQEQKYTECMNKVKVDTGIEFFRTHYGAASLMCHDESNKPPKYYFFG